MKVVLVDTFPPELDAVADASPRATFYHTGTWLLSLVAAYPHMRARWLVAEDGSRPIAYLPCVSTRRGPFDSWWSLPFGTYGGPVGEAETFPDLMAAFRRLGERRNALEVGWVDFFNHIDTLNGEQESASAHVVDISPGFEFVWRERFDKLRRRRSRNAEEKGIVVRRTSDVADVGRFVALYRTRLEGWAAGSGYPDRLFRDLVGNGGGRVGMYLAEREGEVLGGHVNFYYKDAVTAWCGMASKVGNELHAGTLLYASAMREACEAGFHSYNLGASLGKASLEEYKRSLGGEPYSYRIVRHRRMAGRVVAALRGRRHSR